MDELKPCQCPFCGYEKVEVLEHKYPHLLTTYGVKCYRCLTQSYQYYSTAKEAIEAWNRRPERKKGKWIKKAYLLGTSHFCSLCGSNYGMPHDVYNFCPNCGARMEDV